MLQRTKCDGTRTAKNNRLQLLKSTFFGSMHSSTLKTSFELGSMSSPVATLTFAFKRSTVFWWPCRRTFACLTAYIYWCSSVRPTPRRHWVRPTDRIRLLPWETCRLSTNMEIVEFHELNYMRKKESQQKPKGWGKSLFFTTRCWATNGAVHNWCAFLCIMVCCI